MLKLSLNLAHEDTLIPRISIIPTGMPLDKIVFFSEILQFPIRLAFSTAINKAHGQSFNVYGGLNLENPRFSHGQLCVACTRVEQPNNLYGFCLKRRKTKHIVYPKALE